jgi:hypothetical protein
MFPVTRPTRQAAATLALVVLTVLPTLYVAHTAWRIRRPRHLRAVEAAIGARLGFVVSLDSVRYPKPREVVYRGVVLRQEEPRKKGLVEIGRAKEVRLRQGDRELTLEARGVALRAESPRLAIAEIGSMLQRSNDDANEHVGMTVDTLDVDLGSGIEPYHLRDVVGNYVADSSAPAIRASYRFVSPGASTRCELAMTRDRKAEPVRTTLAFKTVEGLPLPARVLDPFFDSVSWFGRDAKVDGSITLRQEGGGDWEAEFQGNLFEIELSELVNRRFPMHRLSGCARLSVASSRWAERPGQGFGWVEASGELTAGPGVVGFGLLQALRTEMKFRPGPRLARIVTTGRLDLNFQALALGFAMTQDGEIQLHGALGNEFAPDAVIVGATSPLVFAPEGAANVRGLIKMLVPVTAINHATMVPLTQRSRVLMALPVPAEVGTKPIDGN